MKGLIITLFDSRHFAYRKINSEGFFLKPENNQDSVWQLLKFKCTVTFKFYLFCIDYKAKTVP